MRKAVPLTCMLTESERLNGIRWYYASEAGHHMLVFRNTFQS